MSQKYQKLVRDNIPEIIRQNGEKPTVRALGVKEFKSEIRKKFVEEVAELVHAEGRQNILEELADIQEVLTTFYEIENISCSEVTKVAKAKRKLRGSFSKRLFLEDVIVY